MFRSQNRQTSQNVASPIKIEAFWDHFKSVFIRYFSEEPIDTHKNSSKKQKLKKIKRGYIVWSIVPYFTDIENPIFIRLKDDIEKTNGYYISITDIYPPDNHPDSLFNRQNPKTIYGQVNNPDETDDPNVEELVVRVKYRPVLLLKKTSNQAIGLPLQTEYDDSLTLQEIFTAFPIPLRCNNSQNTKWSNIMFKPTLILFPQNESIKVCARISPKFCDILEVLLHYTA